MEMKMKDEKKFPNLEFFKKIAADQAAYRLRIVI